MKKLFLLCLFIVFNTVSGQKQTLFLDTDFNLAIKESKIENKPIALMFYANWCVHCNKMKNEIFTDKDVINFYSNAFICVAVDAESLTGTNLKAKFKEAFIIKSYPTFAFIDSDESVMSCIAGEFKKDDFIKEGRNILLPENQFKNIKNNFFADVSNPDNCLKYITILRRAGLDATLVTQQYLKTKNKSDFFTELNWRIIANGINSIDADEIQYIVENKENFAKVSSATRVDKKLVFIAADNLKPLADVGDTINYYKKRPIAENFKIRKVDSLLFRYDLLIFENVKNWKNYQKAAASSVEKFASKDPTTLIEISSNYLTQIKNKTGIDNAINWTKQALAISESLDKYILLSKLYLKEKDFKNALDYAQKGMQTAVNFGWKTEEITNLISEIKNKHK